MRVKLYGGPAHGRVMELPERQHRFEVMQPDYAEDLCSLYQDRVYQDWTVPRYETKTFTYHIHEWLEVRMQPSARRSLWVGVMEGTELLQREEMELRYDIRNVRWTLQPASILAAFDQWFAWTVYKVTGKVTWKAQEVYY